MASYTILIKDAIIENKNFRGLEKTNNTAGSRNFTVRLTPYQEIGFDIYDNGHNENFIGTVQDLINQGWNIKPHNSYNQETGTYEPDGDYTLSSVKVSFRNDRYQPCIRYYPNADTKSFVLLNESLLNPDGQYGAIIDDRGSFAHCDVSIHGYNDKPGHVSAYVQNMAIVGRPTFFGNLGYDTVEEQY